MQGSTKIKRSESIADIDNMVTDKPHRKTSYDDRQNTWKAASPPSPLTPTVMSVSAPSLTPVDQEFSFPEDTTAMTLASEFDVPSPDTSNKQGYLTKQGVCCSVLFVVCIILTITSENSEKLETEMVQTRTSRSRGFVMLL